MGCISTKATEKNVRSPVTTTRYSGVHELKQNYRIASDTKVLGAGSYGKVFLSENIADPSFKVAIKVLNKAKLKDQLDSIKEEVRILTELDHPNIVKYYETYDDTKYIYLVMEYCPGGELFDRIASQKNQVFNESEACQIMKKLFRAINHCHSNGIVHRDIKPENIMFNADDEIKLIDFGLSKKSMKKDTQLQTFAGTPYYMAPEILEGNYDYKCDIWSLGVLMYVLLSGYLPFQGENRNEVFKKITHAKYHFNHKEFKMVSDEGKALIQKLLVIDPDNRYDATQALKDPWFQKFKQIQKGCEEDKLDANIINSLRKYRGVSALKKAAMTILVKMLDAKEIESLRDIFLNIDKDGTGCISGFELKQALSDSNFHLAEKEIESIIDEVDYHGKKKINYSEFLAATISVKKILTDEKLLAIFKQFDTDANGKITADNIVEAMKKLGHKITSKDIKEIMDKHDFKRDGYLSYDEFKQVFLGIDTAN